MGYIEVKDLILHLCPLCGKVVKFFKFQEGIQCKIVCTGCETEFVFKRGLDSKEVINRWNKLSNNLGSAVDTIVEFESEDYETTLCMEGPNRFETVRYKPTCPHGYIDCVWDPAYIFATYPEWYSRLHGEQPPTEVQCEACLNGERYDDEDK